MVGGAAIARGRGGGGGVGGAVWCWELTTISCPCKVLVAPCAELRMFLGWDGKTRHCTTVHHPPLVS